MERIKVSSLEPLLKLSASVDPTDLCSDAAVLSCGCVVSERFFLPLVDSSGTTSCPECMKSNVTFLKPIRQLRDLYNIISQVLSESTPRTRRRSSSKKSIKGPNDPINERSVGEQMDLVSLFYRYAKEETSQYLVSSDNAHVNPIDINHQRPKSNSSYINSNSISPLRKMSINPGESVGMLSESYLERERVKSKAPKYEDLLVSDITEEKEYNFSKCFPFHRKLTTFQTQQGRLFSSSLFKGSMIKKTGRFIANDIHTSTDFVTGQEITRFVSITEKRWELYELVEDPEMHPVLVCCGKSSGEYGPSFNELREDYGHEVVIRNDFSGNSSANSTSTDLGHKKRLGSWEFISCRLSGDFLAISGTKGIMRVFNVSKTSLPHELGQPVYTYITNFPIRCIAISNNDPLIACGITAKERISGKEQPFVVLHKLVRSVAADRIIGSVEPITITIPYRDPIKLINFNATSTHLMCCTVWESRYLIIRLRSSGSDNFRKPRLIWTDSSVLRSSKRKKSDGALYDDSDDDNSDDNALMMDNEGITDAQFGAIPNTVVLTSCSLQHRPPLMLRLEGSTIDSSQGRHLSDALSFESSLNSRHDGNDDGYDITNIKSSELLMKFSEVGFSIHKSALSPRRDALAFLDKDGRVYLVSIPNFELNLNSSPKKVVVLLGEVANAERYVEAAAISFSADGGRVYVSDRRGALSVFDFTKGIPGQDSDVVKCRIISA
ncbi:SPS-sensor component ptr3 [Yamadazyma tenuis]|uniref:SPS-sensor component PTR3 n=1 Tax=Candida tenuis (strain ATCC 10573 / BCRC 21748 / CBS 615 / JCM 9827 / NBRC 10315 / NRRL Y-1498 / VKM Y-70) TaxID=590646 RepID=G3B2L2_CANTC|nr:uncharacterized protein CANTEDRAFT_120576 [Yamadazyma tenuis ATCC 10573]EGV64706.1 hypothetical protein CANTEDRAFT_120576 [Yamadazyma tenuis ATCC 10573]WEJ97493.1 SPS-sensor component ptr3 [Yamadazyma tenuis]